MFLGYASFFLSDFLGYFWKISIILMLSGIGCWWWAKDCSSWQLWLMSVSVHSLLSNQHEQGLCEIRRLRQRSLVPVGVNDLITSSFFLFYFVYSVSAILMIHIIAHALKINFNSEISKYTINSHVWGEVELRKELLQLWNVQGTDMKSHRRHTGLKFKKKRSQSHNFRDGRTLCILFIKNHQIKTWRFIWGLFKVCLLYIVSIQVCKSCHTHFMWLLTFVFIEMAD